MVQNMRVRVYADVGLQFGPLNHDGPQSTERQMTYNPQPIFASYLMQNCSPAKWGRTLLYNLLGNKPRHGTFPVFQPWQAGMEKMQMEYRYENNFITILDFESMVQKQKSYL
jgi:hypothetical protein